MAGWMGSSFGQFWQIHVASKENCPMILAAFRRGYWVMEGSVFERDPGLTTTTTTTTTIAVQ